MQLNLSPEAIQAIRAQMGLAPASAAEVQEQLNNVAPSLNQAPVLPSPGSSAWYRMQQENPGMLAQLEAERDAARAAASASPINANVTAAAGDRPPGVSQYVWDRVTNGTFAGLNLGSITRDPETRDALIEAGYGDYVRSAYEQAQQQRYDYYGANNTDGSDVLDTAREDWYTQNYGEWTPDDSAGSSSDGGNSLSSGESHNWNPGNTGGNAGGGGGQSGDGGGGNGGGTVDLSPGAGASGSAGERNRNYSVAQAGLSSAPVNTGIGTAGQNAATPFADAYVRAANRAQAEGPVTSMFKKFMQD